MSHNQTEFRRVSGDETTWVLQAVVDGQWVTFKGLFVKDLADAAATVAAAKASRPDITDWRAFDVATDTVLATY